MKKKVLILVGAGCFLILVIVALVMGLVVGPNMEREAILSKYPDRGVPRINIDLNGVSLDEIKAGSKEEKYEGNKVTIIGEDGLQNRELVQESSGKRDRGETNQKKKNQMVGGRNDTWEFDDVQVKGRGNWTWVQEKKPYQIKFKEKVDLFGMGKARKWILLANASDPTNLRTLAAFYIERMLGVRNAFNGEFVELYVDGEYEGLYYLTHAVEIGKSTVDLKDPMGVLVELDNVNGRLEEHYVSGNGDILVVKDIVSKDNLDVAAESFLEDYNSLEKAVAEVDYKKVSELIDVDSFAKYYLLSEFVVDPDAYWTSFYLYKDGEADKIHAGPGWDYDLAFANKAWGNWMGEEFYSPTKTMVRKGEIMTKEMYEELGFSGASGAHWYGVSLSLSHIMFDLMEIPEFQEEVKQVYMEKMEGRKEELMQVIKQNAERIEELVMINDEKWGDNGYSGEVDTMEEWIDERYRYFDEVYNGN